MSKCDKSNDKSDDAKADYTFMSIGPFETVKHTPYNDLKISHHEMINRHHLGDNRDNGNNLKRNSMKRKISLIEPFDADLLKLNTKKISGESNKMHKNTIWYKSLLNAEKTCLKEDKIKKIHYKFDDGKEMVEEYNVDTHVLLRRAWKPKGKLGGEGKWSVEVGDPIPDATPIVDGLDMSESKDQPTLLKRNTRVNIEWRIRNLPYPIETYSIKANNEDKCIVISTSNKKFYKKLEVPELYRLGLPIEQLNIDATHKFNTLIITYKKPVQLLELDKDLYEELNKVKPMKDIPNDCKTQ